MKPAAARWTVRAGLLVLAALGPAIGFALRAGQTGNAETALGGLAWGASATLAALIGFAFTFPTSPVGRLGRFAGALAGVLAVWGLALWAANF